jgi:hypothetical protein
MYHFLSSSDVSPRRLTARARARWWKRKNASDINGNKAQRAKRLNRAEHISWSAYLPDHEIMPEPCLAERAAHQQRTKVLGQPKGSGRR